MSNNNMTSNDAASNSQDSQLDAVERTVDVGTHAYVNDGLDQGDAFDTLRVGEQVARMALQVATPFTLGVTGKWGSGKTSVLRRGFLTLGGQEIQVAVPFAEPVADPEPWNRWSKDWDSRREKLRWDDEEIETGRRSLCVWYSPWQHQQAENPLLPLLLEIRDQFAVHTKVLGVARQAALAGATLLERVIDGALILTGTSKRPVATGTTAAVSQAWQEAGADTRLDDGQRFHLLFQDAVQTVLEGLTTGKVKRPEGPEGGREISKGRLVVFIDDLDRCEEKAVVELLEAIKLYLAAPDCVFVLGIDESAVLSALGRYWQRSEDDNREYLEKLFQAVVPVPLPSSEAVCRWVAGQLRRHDFEMAGDCAEMVVEILESNPRKVKNFVNSLCVAWQLHGKDHLAADDDGGSEFEQRFILVQYLRFFHKPIWRLLERDPRILRLITRALGGLGDPVDGVADLDASDLDLSDQRVLQNFIFESFSHVLGRDPTVVEPALEATSAGRHGHMTMDRAVELFAQRLDRKRSDQKFRYRYQRLFRHGEDLQPVFLHLPSRAAESTGEAP